MTRALFPFTVLAMIFATGVSAASAADAGSISQPGPNQWRASKLAGVAILGPDNTMVGKVSDILMDQNGKAEYVVIGVGGFLGLGEKDVAVPFDQVKFTSQTLMPPANPAPGNNLATPATTATAPAGGAAPNGGIAPATTVGLGTPADNSANPAMPAGVAAPAAHATAYPDHGTIDMTKDQLKGAPSFHFAS